MAESSIRVGIVRCDTHAAWFGVLMDRHDPRRLRHPIPDDAEATYGWQRGGTVHPFFYRGFGDPNLMTVAPVAGFRIVKVWDPERQAAETYARVFQDRPVVCDALEAVSDDVDLVLLGDCNFDGSDHLELAGPGLRKGVATFVDKPFGGTEARGRALLELADRHGAVITTASILTFMPAVAQFVSRFAEIGQVHAIGIEGGGTSSAGLVHTIGLAHHLVGATGPEVSVIDGPRQTVIHLDYGAAPGRPQAGVTIKCNISAPASGMYANAYGEQGRVDVTVNDWKYTHGAAAILRHVRDMVTSRRTPRPQVEAMLAALTTMDTARSMMTSEKP